MTRLSYGDIMHRLLWHQACVFTESVACDQDTGLETEAYMPRCHCHAGGTRSYRSSDIDSVASELIGDLKHTSASFQTLPEPGKAQSSTGPSAASADLSACPLVIR